MKRDKSPYLRLRAQTMERAVATLFTSSLGPLRGFFVPGRNDWAGGAKCMVISQTTALLLQGFFFERSPSFLPLARSTNSEQNGVQHRKFVKGSGPMTAPTSQNRTNDNILQFSSPLEDTASVCAVRPSHGAVHESGLPEAGAIRLTYRCAQSPPSDRASASALIRMTFALLMGL
jgi:hypothetical protein